MTVIEQIERDKKRPIMMFSLSAVMIAMSIMSIVVGLQVQATLNIVFGVIGIAFFAGMLIVFGKDFMTNTPYLRVTNEDFSYDKKTFAWDEVREVKIADFGKGKVILVNLHNPQSYWESLSKIHRKMAEMNAQNGGHVQINLTKSTNVDPQQVLEQMQQAHRQSTGIKLQDEGKKRRIRASFK
ncbi:MAG: STM3941 family protein [Caryophanon sp.]|nr:STM3941 family protein [Caryophanon sp.]